MGNVDKKEALRNVLKDVRNAHGLIFEYDSRMLHVLSYLVDNLIKEHTTIHKYPYIYDKVKGFDTIWNPRFVELFFKRERKRKEKKEKKVFAILVFTGNTENEKSQLIFILDEKDFFLDRPVKQEKEYYFTNIINEDKTVLETLEQKECKILRRNIEDFYNEEAIKKEWEESIRDFLSTYLTF